MFKAYKIFITLIFINLASPVFAHVDHYKDLNRIEFDILRNNQNIGKHVFSFNKSNGKLFVKSVISFQIKKLGVILYKYHTEGTEIYENEKLIKFNSKTKQNGKEKYVNLTLENDQFLIDGSSYKGKAPSDYQIGTWWNHSLIDSPAQISAVSGRIIKQKVSFIGKEKITFKSKTYDALHFNFSSTDEKLSKDKRLNTDVWYDENSLSWIKATFKKKGDWEYRLVLIK